MLRILILLLPLLLAAQQVDPQLMAALKAHQAGDLDTAVNAYRVYLKTNQGNWQVRSNLGAALAGKGLLRDAIQEYKLALKAAPDNPQIALNLALAHYKLGEVQDAARELNTLHLLMPSDARVTMLLADSLLMMGESQRAVKLLSPLQEANPEDPALNYMLGTAYMNEKDMQKAQVYLDRVLRQGESAQALLLLGTAKMGVSDFAGALKDLEKAVSLAPELPSANGLYGQALMATGDTPGAGKAFRKELAINPANFDAALNLAVLLKQDQEFAEARTLLANCLRIRPGELRVRYQLASIALAEGKAEESLKLLESVVKEAPQFTEAHVTLATVYYRLKRKEDGDRERAIVAKLNEEEQKRQPKGEALPANQ